MKWFSQLKLREIRVDWENDRNVDISREIEKSFPEEYYEIDKRIILNKVLEIRRHFQTIGAHQQ